MKDTVDILLVGEVGTDITEIAFDKLLRKVGHRPIRVTLRSDGGEFAVANAIYHRMVEVRDRQGLSITAVRALSAGAWILLAADDRRIAKNGTVMIHNVITKRSDCFTPTDLRRRASDLEGISSLMSNTIAERTGLDHSEVFGLMESEAHLNASRALELGFATEICDEIY